MIFIVVVLIAFGIAGAQFGFKSKKEEYKNKTGAQIYVGDKKIVWILGFIFFSVGGLEIILLLFSYNEEHLYALLLMCIIAQWGVALFFWIHFCYSAVFLHEGKVWFYRKMKKKEILAENIAEVKVALGNVAYAFYDENNNLLFEIQMKKENAGEFMKYMNERLCL